MPFRTDINIVRTFMKKVGYREVEHVIISCKTCEEEREYPRTDVMEGRGRFCGRQCASRWRSMKAKEAKLAEARAHGYDDPNIIWVDKLKFRRVKGRRYYKRMK